MYAPPWVGCFFFFNDTATTEIYTLSLHDALPISQPASSSVLPKPEALLTRMSMPPSAAAASTSWSTTPRVSRSEEHTSELQSRPHLVCRLLLEKKKQPPPTRCPRRSGSGSRRRPS